MLGTFFFPPFAFGFKFHTAVLGVILLRTDGERDCLFPCPTLEFSQPHSLWVLRVLTSVWDVCVGLVALAALLQGVRNSVNEEGSQLHIVRQWNKR